MVNVEKPFAAYFIDVCYFKHEDIDMRLSEEVFSSVTTKHKTIHYIMVHGEKSVVSHFNDTSSILK